MKFFKVIYKKLGKGKAWGWAHYDTNTIELDVRLKGKKHCEILTHEALHLLFPKESEIDITRKSILLTNTLWKEGYRRIDDTNDVPLQDGSK